MLSEISDKALAAVMQFERICRYETTHGRNRIGIDSRVAIMIDAERAPKPEHDRVPHSRGCVA